MKPKIIYIYNISISLLFIY